MTKPLAPEIKKQRTIERKEKLERNRQIKRKELTGIINVYSSPYKAAKKFRISPSAFYERMDRVGLQREVNHLLEGEPKNKKEKRKWLRGLLKEHTVAELAKRLGRSKTAIRDRLKKVNVKPRPKLK